LAALCCHFRLIIRKILKNSVNGQWRWVFVSYNGLKQDFGLLVCTVEDISLFSCRWQSNIMMTAKDF
jgi:hypothetical protein